MTAAFLLLGKNSAGLGHSLPQVCKANTQSAAESPMGLSTSVQAQKVILLKARHHNTHPRQHSITCTLTLLSCYRREWLPRIDKHISVSK